MPIPNVNQAVGLFRVCTTFIKWDDFSQVRSATNLRVFLVEKAQIKDQVRGATSLALFKRNFEVTD